MQNRSLVIISKCFKFIQLTTYHVEWMAKEWMAPVYAIFEPHRSIKVIGGWCCHEFKCTTPQCKGNGQGNPRIVWRFLDTGDQVSTSNMHWHAAWCWGTDLVQEAYDAKTKNGVEIDGIRNGIANAKRLKDGTITTSFKLKGKGKPTYSMQQLTYAEIRWVLQFTILPYLQLIL